MRTALLSILLYVLVAILGAGAGYVLGQAGAPAPAAEDEADHEDHGPAIPEATLKSLGVTTGKAALANYWESRRIAAVVTEPPLARRPVYALVGGLVTKVHVDVGAPVKAGDALVTIQREPVARPTPTVTAEILSPVNERVHEAAASLRTAMRRLDIAKREIERLKSLKGGAAAGLNKQRLIDLAYEQERAEQAVENAEHELLHHGLSEAEIAAVAAGNRPPPGRSLWQRALAANDLWPAAAEAIYEALPEASRKEPWTVAAIGELAASGLVSDALAMLLKTHPQAAERFVTVAGLLLEGTSLPALERLATEGGLAPELVVRAPKAGTFGLDVLDVHVREGAQIAAGASLVTLIDRSTLWMRLEPIGGEIADVKAALSASTPLKASSLIRGAGPQMAGLRLEWLAPKDGETGTGVAYAAVRNTVVSDNGRRSWELRAGMRYRVEIPLEQMKGRFVLPRGAVAEEGPNRIVFLVNGSTFEPVVVQVEHEGEDVIVIANDGAITPGDEIVTNGAFALQMALGQKPGGADAHHGHSHG